MHFEDFEKPNSVHYSDMRVGAVKQMWMDIRQLMPNSHIQSLFKPNCKKTTFTCDMVFIARF